MNDFIVAAKIDEIRTSDLVPKKRIWAQLEECVAFLRKLNNLSVHWVFFGNQSLERFRLLQNMSSSNFLHYSSLTLDYMNHSFMYCQLQSIIFIPTVFCFYARVMVAFYAKVLLSIHNKLIFVNILEGSEWLINELGYQICVWISSQQ